MLRKFSVGKSIKESLQEENFKEFWQVEGHGVKRVEGWAPIHGI